MTKPLLVITEVRAFLVAGRQVCTHLRRDFVLFLFADPLQVIKVLKLTFGISSLQLPPQIFYETKVWRLTTRPLQDINVLLLEPLLCCLGRVFGVLSCWCRALSREKIQKIIAGQHIPKDPPPPPPLTDCPKSPFLMRSLKTRRDLRKTSQCFSTRTGQGPLYLDMVPDDHSNAWLNNGRLFYGETPSLNLHRYTSKVTSPPPESPFRPLAFHRNRLFIFSDRTKKLKLA